jgi:hypothetical protein
MAKLFISHSSQDKEFARQLAEDIKQIGHTPWLDEWEIKVGESIPKRIEQGVAEADYVVLVLSPNSTASNWVEAEWRAKYWNEAEQGQIMVLPALIADCEIPGLLKPKRYADFRKSYSVGLVQLMAAIPDINPTETQERLPQSPGTAAISALILKLQSGSQSLAQSMTEALTTAREIRNASLEAFARNELAGFRAKAKLRDEDADFPRYRRVSAYLSWGLLNVNYFGFRGAGSVSNYMEAHPDDFVPYGLLFTQPIAEIERNAEKVAPGEGVLSTSTKAKDVMENPKEHDRTIYIYAKPEAWVDIREAVKAELTGRLLDLLPTVEADA